MTTVAKLTKQGQSASKLSSDAEKRQKAKVPESAKKAMATARRQSNRIASKKRENPPGTNAPTSNLKAVHNEKENGKDVLQFFSTKMDMILEGIARLGIDGKGNDIKDNKVAESDNINVSSSYGSDKTVVLVPLREEREGGICEQLFKPAGYVPKLKDLRKALLNEPAARIPIHQYVYDRLKEDVAVSELDKYFSIVEQVGNIAPQLTPRVETALLVNNVNVGTESMQQHVMDAFLM
ncbi:hypothetical protein GGI22_005812, partial [Coemansia erecta]